MACRSTIAHTIADHTVASICQEYHIGTKYIAQWLANAGYRHVINQSLARQVQQASTGGGSCRLELATHDMIALAEAVEQAVNKGGQHPTGIDTAIKVLKSTVRGRRECAEWYRRRGEKDPNELELDQSHQSFIQALDIILDALLRANKARVVEPVVTPTKKAASRYSCLTVEDIDDEQMDISSPSSSVDTAKLEASMELEVDIVDEPDDSAYHVIIFLEKCLGLRKYVCDQWREYCEGRLRFTDVAMLSESAHQLLQNEVATIAIDFPVLDDLGEILEKLSVKIQTDNGECSYFQSAAAEGYDIDAFCPTAAVVATIFDHYFKVSPEQRDVVEAHLAAQHELGLRLYLHAHSFYGFANHWRAADSPLDTFAAQYLDFLAGNGTKISLAFVLQMQTEMDVYDISCSHASEMLQEFLDVIVRTAQSYDKIEKVLKKATPFMQRRIKEILQQWKTYADHIIREATGVGIKDAAELTVEAMRDKLVAQIPSLCAAYTRTLADALRLSGIDLLNCSSIGAAMGHLYSACRQTGNLTTPWVDMDNFIQNQGAIALGLSDLGPATTTPRLTLAKRFGLAMGVRLSQYAPKTGRTLIGGVCRTHLPDDTTVHIQCRDPMTFMRHRDIEPGRRSPGRSMPERLSIAAHDLAKERAKSHPETIDEAMKETLKDNAPLSSVQMLAVIKSSLASDALAIDIDYYGLFVDLFELLLQMQEEILTSFKQYKIAREIAKIRDPHLVVDEILWTEAKREQQLLSTQPVKLPKLLEVCARVFEKHIGDNDVALRDTAVASSKSARSLQPMPTGTPVCDKTTDVSVMTAKLEGRRLELNPWADDVLEAADEVRLAANVSEAQRQSSKKASQKGKRKNRKAKEAGED